MKKFFVLFLLLCGVMVLSGVAFAVETDAVRLEEVDPIGGGTPSALTVNQKSGMLALLAIGDVAQSGTYEYNKATVTIPVAGKSALYLWNPTTSRWVNVFPGARAAADEVSASATADITLKDTDVYNQLATTGKIKMSYFATVGKDDSSSGGCSAFSLGALALMLAPMALLGRKKK